MLLPTAVMKRSTRGAGITRAGRSRGRAACQALTCVASRMLSRRNGISNSALQSWGNSPKKPLGPGAAGVGTTVGPSCGRAED